MATSGTWTWSVPFPKPLLPLKRLWYAFCASVYVCVCACACVHPHCCPPRLGCHHLPPRLLTPGLVSLPLGCMHSRGPTHSNLRLLWSQRAPLCYRPLVAPPTHRSPKSPSGLQTFSKSPPIFSVWPHPFIPTLQHEFSIHACSADFRAPAIGGVTSVPNVKSSLSFCPNCPCPSSEEPNPSSTKGPPPPKFSPNN